MDSSSDIVQMKVARRLNIFRQKQKADNKSVQEFKENKEPRNCCAIAVNLFPFSAVGRQLSVLSRCLKSVVSLFLLCVLIKGVVFFINEKYYDSHL